MATGYLSLVLDSESSERLAQAYATLPEIYCHHMTVVFGTHELSALPPALAGSQPGDSFTLKVIGFARSNSIEAVAVGLFVDGQIVTEGISSNDIPHVTVALVPGQATAFQSNALLGNGYETVADGLVLKATLKVVKFEPKG